MSSRKGLPGLVFATAAGAAMAGPAAPPLPIHCSASGAKLVSSLAPDAICQRFIAAYAAASGRPAVAGAAPPDRMADGLIIALHFGPQGLASVSAMAVHGGIAAPVQRFELAVSDRPFSVTDIDRLAADTAKAVAAR